MDAVATVANVCGAGLILAAIASTVRVRRVGGLLFWRVGRVGGSLYIARGER